jgi:hypothetical protein
MDAMAMPASLVRKLQGIEAEEGLTMPEEQAGVPGESTHMAAFFVSSWG